MFQTGAAACLVAGLLLFPHATVAQSPQTYPRAQGGEITLPMGDLSFADRVVSFEMGPMGNQPDVAYDPDNALGPPRHREHADGSYVALGCGGSIVLEFTDNALIDVPGPDLHVWEIGGYVEATDLAISKDGKEWIEIGRISGSTASIDIADHVQPGDTFRVVRLIDLKDNCHRWPGAEIDAVAAVGTAERFVFDSAILFPFDEAALTDDAREVLGEFAEQISEQTISALHIEGHTDSMGAAAYNLDLSQQRADAVLRYLETLPAFSGIVMNTRGAGFTEPVADNDTEERRAQNRRVEIIAVP